MTTATIGRDFVGAECTLDGETAIVAGRLLDFARVMTLPAGPAYDYAWSTVELVMTEKDGAFRS